MSDYDPEARRDTPLALKLAARIRRGGPITVARYMEACLQYPEHGYYVKRPAIGASGDFITAPEISQLFGELVGLWCVVVWQQMGEPSRVELVELGPGRGTLMADALRAARVVTGFLAAVQVSLIDSDVALVTQQRAALSGVGVPLNWTPSFAAQERRAPTIVLANEFLDALPISQYVLSELGWRERTVGLDERGRLVFDVSDTAPGHADQGRFSARPGDIMELRGSTPLLAEIGAAATHVPLAALLIDYGHSASMVGDTLQAVRNHSYEHPLTSPGEADLTSQVDFDELAERAASFGLAVDGPMPQGRFLAALGAAERASRLMALNPSKAAEIEAGASRLLSPTGMGTRFKVIGLRSPQVLPLPGLAAG
jgi:NADH dehydrogenase [ubiquinone] 1 alpha subcomplex assembly factor 7